MLFSVIISNWILWLLALNFLLFFVLTPFFFHNRWNARDSHSTLHIVETLFVNHQNARALILQCFVENNVWLWYMYAYEYYCDRIRGCHMSAIAVVVMCDMPPNSLNVHRMRTYVECTSCTALKRPWTVLAMISTMLRNQLFYVLHYNYKSCLIVIYLFVWPFIYNSRPSVSPHPAVAHSWPGSTPARVRHSGWTSAVYSIIPLSSSSARSFRKLSWESYSGCWIICFSRNHCSDGSLLKRLWFPTKTCVKNMLMGASLKYNSTQCTCSRGKGRTQQRPSDEIISHMRFLFLFFYFYYSNYHYYYCCCCCCCWWWWWWWCCYYSTCYLLLQLVLLVLLTRNALQL